MFEITADDIAKLDDEELRAVVARLCKAELRQNAVCTPFKGISSLKLADP